MTLLVAFLICISAIVFVAHAFDAYHAGKRDFGITAARIRRIAIGEPLLLGGCDSPRRLAPSRD